MYFLWALLAAIPALTLEVLFRKGIGWDSWGHIVMVIPILVLLNYSLWRTVSGGPTLIFAIALFSASVAVGRIFTSQFLLGEMVTKGNLVAAVALVFASLVGALWRSDQ